MRVEFFRRAEISQDVQAVEAIRGGEDGPHGRRLHLADERRRILPGGREVLLDRGALMLEAVEVYRGPAEIPVRFRQRETACGVIALWTREPPSKQAQRPPGGA